jgi:DNA-binding response OmpR family regulator
MNCYKHNFTFSKEIYLYHILVVEDSVEIQLLMSSVLKPIGLVRIAPSVKSGLEEFQTQKFDLIMMDVLLEDGTGFELTEKIRQMPGGKSIPIIFLTSQSHIDDKIRGFDLGAEDYIVKPSDPREIRLRVEARLKKIEAAKLQQAGHQKNLTIGNLQLDVPLQKVQLIQENIDLGVTPLQFKILYYLMTRENQVVSRDELISEIWGKNVHIGRSVDTHINSLRRKLDQYSSCIQGIYGAGYSFQSK